jgi:hypothetical protein
MTSREGVEGGGAVVCRLLSLVFSTGGRGGNYTCLLHEAEFFSDYTLYPHVYKRFRID